MDQQVPVLRVVNEYHCGREPPTTTSVQDRETTAAMFSPTFCKVDWRLFDPSALAWRFHGAAYEGALKRLTRFPPVGILPSMRLNGIMA